MRFRQIHLDFHTSPLIPDIGSRFDADTFGKAFKDASVDSVTVFSKCHHGHSYHPTEIGRMHPHLDFDLLRAQIDSLHASGVNAPVYLTATWDELAAEQHPEWRTVLPDGTLPRFRAEPNGAGWAILDLSTPYLDYLCAQTEEVMLRYPDADGIFMDICWQLPSVSAHARQSMDAEGLDWTNAADRELYTARAVEHFFDAITSVVRKHDPNMPLFFNSGHIRRGLRDHIAKYYTHLELESLPTAGWGYDHFPLSARYVDPLDIPFLGMTGKFHYSWGEVGGYKKPDALVFECGAMLAQGAHCSIGDHLHPTASIDASTMKVIGPAYKWVAERESWCIGTKNRAQIAVLSQEAIERPSLSGRPNHHVAADEGVVRVLLEGQFTFDVVDSESDFTAYQLLVLADTIVVDAALQAKITAYTEKGGRVLLTGKSGIDPDRGFVFDVGGTWHGTNPMTGGDYMLPDSSLRAADVDEPLFMYLPSERLIPADGVALGQIYDPYFDRTPRHFSGHVNAPSRPDPTPFAAGVSKGAYTYFAHPIFTCYMRAGAVAMLEIAEKLIAYALGQDRTMFTTLPRAGRVSIRTQASERRDIVHLLHAMPAQRGNINGTSIQPIQDLVTLHNIDVSAGVSGAAQSVRLVPELINIAFLQQNGRVTFTVPSVRGHQMIEIAYA